MFKKEDEDKESKKIWNINSFSVKTIETEVEQMITKQQKEETLIEGSPRISLLK